MLFCALAASAPVLAQPGQDLDEARQRRDEVRSEAADVAGGIDALTSEANDLIAELSLLDVRIAAIDSRLTAAEGAVARTETALENARAAAGALEDRRAGLQATLVESLIEQYIAGHESAQGSVLTAEDPTGWAMQKGLVTLVATDATGVQDQLRVVEADLADAELAAANLAQDAQGERDQAQDLAADVETAHRAQQELLDQVSERLDRRLAEADALAALDAELSEEIRQGEEEVARRLAVARAKARVAASDNAETTEITETTETPSIDPGTSDRIARSADIVNVRGIEVHFSVAEQLRGLINAAEAAGIILGGGGWRSTEYQIELRMQNCGTTDYLIFEAPSEACWPPTARPASSNHEAGTAVDLTANGRAIVDPNSDAFRWLAANAATYGFYNLWSEPWHWSTDGR